MRGRPSGSLFEEGTTEFADSGDQLERSRNERDSHPLRVEAINQGDTHECKELSIDSTPRSRISLTSLRPQIPKLAIGAPAPTTFDSTDGKRGGDVMDLRDSSRAREHSLWSCSLLTILTTASAIFLVLSIIQSSLTRQMDPGDGCIMSTMSPAYIKLSGFDTEHTRFASKYSLYLYREEGVDEYSQDNIGLRGVPILFIPGNAGSYKQVRSLSSEASHYFQNHVRNDEVALRNGARSLDFFMVDLNEDLAAFHGQTILDQADYVNEAVAYILSLYHDTRHAQRDQRLPDPSSVILIGHSMGGIVARTVLINPNYQANSVNTIITMSTPHARPPISFDADIVKTFRMINDYWRDAYTQRWSSNNPLWHTTLISIAGGGRDTTVPSDYASLSSIVPGSHGFTVFTSTMPDVWTGMDHLAITWCDQFRKAVIRSLFEIVDVRRSSQTKHRAERIRIFRKWYLTGLEDGTPKKMPHEEPDILLTLGDTTRSCITSSRNLTVRRLGSHKQPTATLLPLAPREGTDNGRLTILTDRAIDMRGSFDSMEVLLCSAFPLQNTQSSTLPIHIDLSDENPGTTRLACRRAKEDAIRLPASTRISRNAFEQSSPFTYLQYNYDDLAEHQFLAIVDKPAEQTEGWVFAEMIDRADGIINVDTSLVRLLLTGVQLMLPAKRPMMIDIRVPALHSSLLTYSLRLSSPACGGDGPLFSPLLRQHLDGPYESKYFVNAKQADIHFHGVAPFMPPALKGESSAQGLAFQIWSDPTCGASLEFTLKADFIGSIGKLVIRYRTVFAAFPLLVVAMVLRKQFRVYDNTGVFMTFTESMEQSLRTALPVLLLSMTLFATAFTDPMSSGFGLNTQTNGTDSRVHFATNDLLLGSQDSFFWFLIPSAGIISIGACIVLNYAVLAIVYSSSIVFSILTIKSGYIKNDETTKNNLHAFGSNAPRRRIFSTMILLLLVATVIPYQFAYLVACIVQLATCTRALHYARETQSTAKQNFFNYTHSMLVLMLWVLPINLPVLVVWGHNLVVHWFTPFSSHHNVLSIMPFILLVETLASGAMVPRVTTRVSYLTNVLFFFFAVYSMMYGVTYAYRLHHLANLVALWLVILHFSVRSGYSFDRLKALLDSELQVDSKDIKKIP